VGDQEASLPADDEALLKMISDRLGTRVGASPYASDGSFAEQISSLPVGLRAMAATHWLDLSLTLDDVTWHFLNFGEPNLVEETEKGLRELGLTELADVFHSAYELVKPHLDQMVLDQGYEDCLQRVGTIEESTRLNDRAWDLAKGPEGAAAGSAIYASWITYARRHPALVFDDILPS
jgi:hypothetical protein